MTQPVGMICMNNFLLLFYGLSFLTCSGSE